VNSIEIHADAIPIAADHLAVDGAIRTIIAI
jgi:hypothetical protein